MSRSSLLLTAILCSFGTEGALAAAAAELKDHSSSSAAVVAATGFGGDGDAGLDEKDPDAMAANGSVAGFCGGGAKAEEL